MAPIEHVWDALGRRVDNRPVKPTTGATLCQTLLEEWNNMSSSYSKHYSFDASPLCCLYHRKRWTYEVHVLNFEIEGICVSNLFSSVSVYCCYCLMYLYMLSNYSLKLISKKESDAFLMMVSIYGYSLFGFFLWWISDKKIKSLCRVLTIQ
jgi:hypothetical protein